MRVVSWNMNKRKEGNWEWILENSEPDYVLAQEASPLPSNIKASVRTTTKKSNRTVFYSKDQNHKRIKMTNDNGMGLIVTNAKEILLIFESAWGGNPEGVQALSSNPLLENALVKYSRKVEGDTSTAKWFFKNGNSVNSKGEIETASVPSQDIINKVELLFQGLEELLAEATELCEQIDMENDDSIGTFCLINITRYEILISTFEDWKNGDIKTLVDVDMAGLAGVDDEGDLEYDEDEKVNDNSFKEWLSDINVEIPIKLAVQKMKKMLET